MIDLLIRLIGLLVRFDGLLIGSSLISFCRFGLPLLRLCPACGQPLPQDLCPRTCRLHLLADRVRSCTGGLSQGIPSESSKELDCLLIGLHCSSKFLTRGSRLPLGYHLLSLG